jgi:RHS repeat-associated protein
LAAAYADPFTATDSQVSAYADYAFEYNAARYVTKETVQGTGCSCGSGLGTFTFSYSSSAFPDGTNTWKVKAVETLPDGNENIVYTNYAGEVLLHVFKETSSGNQWIVYFRHDSDGRLILQALPSAVSGYDETRPDLLNNQSGNYQYLRDASGLIETTAYYTSTTAGESTAGGIAGFLKETKLQRGELGTGILQETVQYYQHTGGGVTVGAVASDTVYRNTDGTGAQTTSLGYTWYASATAVESVTVTYPTVSAAQNGPGTSVQETTYFDSQGRATWHKDGAGFIGYLAYDMATGSVTKLITDVDTTRTSDFTGLPSGWSTPSGGGLHLVAQTEVDALGRVTKLTNAGGNVSYAVYKDSNHEVRIYDGWDSATNRPTGPTVVYREDRPGSYFETLTMSAAPAVDGNGRPTGTEAISSLQTLSRSYTSSAGQVTHADGYFNLSGLTYSTSTTLGTENTHFYRTRYAFDSRGRLARMQTPTGTIYRFVYDAMDRLSSKWVGTNDTPPSGEWSPTNNGAPSNMVKVAEYIYDGGGVGDGNLTKARTIPGGSAAERITDYFPDWRNRVVAVKDGVEASESTSVNRPIVYFTIDNLDEVTQTQQYDGDGVTITDANSDGVPDKPSASLLRAQAEADYDDWGRFYKTQVYSVDPVTGAVSTNALISNVWYDQRGQVLKTAAPGGLVSKAKYDGVGRVTKSYLTDGGGDSSWSDAGNVSGDIVLTQSELQYDANSNPILVISRDRFHDETATGELGDPATAPKARVSYGAAYFDKANRATDTVTVGTNGGTAWTRPSSVPARSDTTLVVSYLYNDAGWVETVTDPRGIAGKSFYDNLGQVTKTIEAYVDGVPSNSDDKTTEYSYDGSGHLLTLKALLAGGGYQKTEWVYGVTTGTGSDVNSNDLLSAVKHPDKTTGDPSNSEKETITVSALGETKTFTDRNGNVHSYSRDVLGRLTADAVTTLGTGVDGAVRRLEIAYDGQGNPYLLSSFDAATGGNVVNQVQRDVNGLGQLVTEYQSHSGVVVTSTTPKVQYAYTEMSGGANHSRLSSITYPNGKVLTYNYSAGLDSNISRLSSLSDNSGTLEAYSYLGLGTVVIRAHPQPGVDLTYVKQSGEANGDAGDQYTGLDRFGRIVDQRWRKTSDGSHTDRFKYGHDRDSNRLFRTNELNHSFDELYHANGAGNGYDPLNQLTEFRRGVLSDTNSDGVPDTVASASRSQSWGFDALGNWTTLTTDGTPQSRTHNQQNQVTQVGGTPLTFDANGNLTQDETGKRYEHDAWNRVARVKNSGGATLVSYQYDFLSRRIVENPGTARDLYYSAAWQVLEERVGGQAQVQYVWSPVYVDALVLRDRDADSNGSLEERLWVQQDANFNVTALVDGSGNVVERYVYDPYGSVTILAPNWTVRASSSYDWVYLHHGGRLDGTSGLYHFGIRDYSSSLGRWAEMDPLGFAARDNNLYRAVANSPTNATDPSGLFLDMGSELEQEGYQGITHAGTGIFAIKPKPQDGPALLEQVEGMMQARGNLMAQGGPVPPLMAGSLPIYGDGNQNAFEAMHEAGQLIWEMNSNVAMTMVSFVPGAGTVIGAYDLIQGIRTGNPLQIASGALPFLHVPRFGRPSVRLNPMYRPGSPMPPVPRWGVQYMRGPGSSAARRMAVEEALELGAIVRTTVQGAGAARPPRHHVFPQPYRRWFRQRGIDIDQYTLPLDQGTHEALHYGGGPGRGGGWWNDTIMQILRAQEAALGRQLTPSEILQVGAQMRRRAGLSHVKCVPYRD